VEHFRERGQSPLSRREHPAQNKEQKEGAEEQDEE